MHDRAFFMTVRRMGPAMVEVVGILSLLLAGQANADVVLIGHANLSKVDDATVQKIFTGKLVEVGGINVVPVNAISGNALRNRFLKTYLNQDDEKYTAYWTVRRYIGKGNPPRELSNSVDIINFVQTTPGAIAYVDETDLKTGLNVLARK